MTTHGERLAFVRIGVYEPKLINQIDFSGSAITFTVNLLHPITNDVNLLLEIIEAALRLGGHQHEVELHALRKKSSAILTNLPHPMAAHVLLYYTNLRFKIKSL
jgi:hypothetical protein